VATLTAVPGETDSTIRIWFGDHVGEDPGWSAELLVGIQYVYSVVDKIRWIPTRHTGELAAAEDAAFRDVSSIGR
jgi:hypothetical protein